MREYKSVGLICVKDKFNIVYSVCKLEYILKEDESFKYVFTPNYSVIDLLGPNLFQGIPGLNLDLKRKEYIRDNYLPCFISERVPQPNREDYIELLEEVGLDYMDPIKYLILTKKKYCGDNFFMIPFKEKESIEINDDYKYDNNLSFIKKILINIGLGNDIIFNNSIINDENRKSFYNIFIGLYGRSYILNKEKQRDRIEKAKEDGRYKGRKPQSVDMVRFNYLEEKVYNKEITRHELMEDLNISKDKYYRLKKQIENEKKKN